MRRRSISVILVAILIAAAQSAVADAAVFTNLGFSPNGRVFMFAQHGIERASGQAYAEIFTVDVPSNQFVPSGVFRRQFTDPVSPGQTGHAALLTLMREAEPLRSSNNINHFLQGRLVYLLLNADEPRPEITFRDFVTGDSYHVVLSQESRGSGSDLAARFHIDLTRTTASGRNESYTVGLPNLFRDGVRHYRIRQALLTPGNRGMVFVVEMEHPSGTGTALRYMVETLEF